MQMAPDCPVGPPPPTVTVTSTFSRAPRRRRASSAFMRSWRMGKYSECLRRLTRNLPSPRRTRTRATELLRRPVAQTSVEEGPVFFGAGAASTFGSGFEITRVSAFAAGFVSAFVSVASGKAASCFAGTLGKDERPGPLGLVGVVGAGEGLELRDHRLPEP